MTTLAPEHELLRDADRLEALLRELLEQHTQLLATMERKRQVMREAQHDAMAALVRLEAESVRRISGLEKQRLELVGAMTLRVMPDAPQPLKLRELAQRLPEPARGRLLVARQQLVDKMQQVQHQTTVARRAADKLVQHMTGILQTIGTLSTGVNTYGSRGQRPEAAITMRTINLTA